MAITLTVGALNLNDSVNYSVIGIDLGSNKREEVWLEPFTTDTPILAKVVNRKCLVTITLRVKGTTAANLVTNVEAVRDAFNGQANTLTYGLGGTTKIMTTYDSQIDPIDTSTTGDFATLYVAASQFILPKWTFSVTRDAKFQSATRPPVI